MNMLKELFSNVAVVNGLDVGTGDGSFIHFLANNLSDFTKITGIDTDASILKIAKDTNADSRITFEAMSGDKICYEDNTFDMVSISNSLHHLTNINDTLNEMLRVLKSGGYFIINELICDGLNEKQQMHLGLHHLQAEIDTILGIVHNKCFTRAEVAAIVDNLGLTEVKSTIHENESFNKYVQIDKLEGRYVGILNQLMGHPAYEKYKLELDRMISDIRRNGIEFQSQLLFLGIKK